MANLEKQFSLTETPLTVEALPQMKVSAPQQARFFFFFFFFFFFSPAVLLAVVRSAREWLAGHGDAVAQCLRTADGDQRWFLF